MNWGQKLIVVFIVFATGMTYLVYRCMHVNTDLVTKEYYKDELKYQEVIDGTRTANTLSAGVALSQQDQVIVIRLPAEMKNENVSGAIWFYCAADANKDRHIPIATNREAEQQIHKSLFLPGVYTVKFDWTAGNKHYHAEQPFRIL